MAIQNTTAEYYTPLRPNFELSAATTALFGALGYEAYAWLGNFPTGPVHWIAGGFALYGLSRAVPAVKLLRRHLHLAGTPIPCHTFDDLRRLFAAPDHQGDMWLGKGFSWGPPHTQLAVDILKQDWPKLSKDALGPIYKWRFMRQHPALCVKHPLLAYRRYVEREKSLQTKGIPWIHGLGNGEKDIFQPLSHSEGHTLIIGTTGSGKTRCFDLLISQAILRNETVFIIDPKGDRDLRDKAKRACEMLGRGDKFLSFHPAHPDESIRINLLANWTRPSEIADRIASLIPSASESDPFKNFAFGALNAICNGLCTVCRNPTLKNLKHYLAGTGSGAVGGLVVDALYRYLLNANPDKTKELEMYIASQKKHDSESMAMALVDYYQKNGPHDPDIDDLVSMFTHNKEHFGKMITSLLPILSMLTSGVLGDMLSPPDGVEERQKATWRDTGELIAWNHVVYVGLDSLSDPMVGSAIGALFLSDLACVAGARYNFEGLEGEIPPNEVAKKGMMAKMPFVGKFFDKESKSEARTVNIFVDEAAEVVNAPFLQILNKGRGAHLKLFVATQTLSDFVARMGSKDRAYQLLGNLNNRICLRCIDTETQNFIADSLPKTKVTSIQRTQGLSTTVNEPVPRGGSLAERMAEEEIALFTPQLLGMLPNLEFIASLSGGHVYKGRYPLILKDKSEYKG